MHPMTYLVYKSIALLEFEQFRHLEDRERLNAIRSLAVQQVNDDTDDTQRERHGRSGRVARWESFDDEGEEKGYDIWPEWTERQRAIIAGLEPVLDMVITAEQRVLLRQVYDEGADQRTIARRLGITQQAVQQRLKTIHRRLREALLKVYGPQEVQR